MHLWKKLAGGSALFVLFWALSAGNAAASFCGIAQKCHRHCCRCCETCHCCTVMKMCCETVMTYEESTTYETVYEDVVEKKPVSVTKYVPETKTRSVNVTIVDALFNKAADNRAILPCRHTPPLVVHFLRDSTGKTRVWAYAFFADQLRK